VISVFKALQKHQLTTHDNYNYNFVIFAYTRSPYWTELNLLMRSVHFGRKPNRKCVCGSLNRTSQNHYGSEPNRTGTGQNHAFNWHQRFIDNFIQQCRNLAWNEMKCVWCCCCCCGGEKYTTIHGRLVNSPVSSHLWSIWTVKATDELCTRTFAVHTLKSPPTKMPKFPDGGKPSPTGGGL